MRVVVTGAGGGVGRAVAEVAPARHEVIPLAHAELPVEDRHLVMQRLVPLEPEVVLHCAALTSVDGCEGDPRAAFRVNALGTANVALAAREAGALLVALSTDYVFDGRKGEPYHEFDEPAPLSVYGRSKLAGEAEARTLAPEHLVVRTSWVFGSGRDFLSRSLERLAAGEAVGAVVDQVSTPTYVRHLAERLLALAVTGRRGLVHLAGPEPASWFEVLERARALGGLPGEVLERKEGDLGRPAPRPPYSALTSVVLDGTDVPPMPPLAAALEEVLDRHGRR